MIISNDQIFNSISLFHIFNTIKSFPHIDTLSVIFSSLDGDGLKHLDLLKESGIKCLQLVIGRIQQIQAYKALFTENSFLLSIMPQLEMLNIKIRISTDTCDLFGARFCKLVAAIRELRLDIEVQELFPESLTDPHPILK